MSPCLLSSRLALLLSLATSLSWAQNPLQAIQEQLIQAEVLRGDFEQEKHLAGFRRPLLAQGRFLLARGQGIVWDTRSPFPSLTVLTGERILSADPDGELKIELDAADQAGLAQVNSLLLALMGAEFESLQAAFDIGATTVDDDGWRLDLEPRPGPLRQVLTAVQLRGDGFVREVRVQERGGDVVQIRFRDLEAASELTPEETALFRKARLD